MAREDCVVRVHKRTDQRPDTDLEQTTPAQRLGMVWQLTLDAWAFTDEAWPERQIVEVEGLLIPVLGRSHLIQNKKAVGRPQDLADVAWLERDRLHGGGTA